MVVHAFDPRTWWELQMGLWQPSLHSNPGLHSVMSQKKKY